MVAELGVGGQIHIRMRRVFPGLMKKVWLVKNLELVGLESRLTLKAKF